MLQEYVDAEELEEQENVYTDLANFKANACPTQRQAREGVELDTKKPKSIRLNYKRNAYLQPVLKKLFDYLQCCYHFETLRVFISSHKRRVTTSPRSGS
jgi:hypothetical protein